VPGGGKGNPHADKGSGGGSANCIATKVKGVSKKREGRPKEIWQKETLQMSKRVPVTKERRMVLTGRDETRFDKRRKILIIAGLRGPRERQGFFCGGRKKKD